MRISFLAGLAFLLLASGDAHAQTITGRVMDFETDAPLPGATVSLLDARESVIRRVLSDSTGKFQMSGLGSGRYQFRVHRIGYEQVTSPHVDLAAPDSIIVELRIAINAIPLAPLTVTAAPRATPRSRVMDGFYERQRRGWGTHFGPGDLERLRPSSIVTLLQMTSGVQIRYVGGTRTEISMRAGIRNCTPSVFVDGVRVPSEVEIDAWATPDALRAVEVYRRASEVPGEFSSILNYNCGAIVLWTESAAS